MIGPEGRAFSNYKGPKVAKQRRLCDSDDNPHLSQKRGVCPLPDEVRLVRATAAMPPHAKICLILSVTINVRLRSLVDKARPSEGRDRRFESCRGHSRRKDFEMNDKDDYHYCETT